MSEVETAKKEQKKKRDAEKLKEGGQFAKKRALASPSSRARDPSSRLSRGRARMSAPHGLALQRLALPLQPWKRQG